MNYILRTGALFFLFFVLSATNAEANLMNESLKEEIRRKIESIEIVNNTNGMEKIYAIHSVRSIYSENDFLPVWNKKHEINEFITELDSAYQEGLNPEDYHKKRLLEILPLVDSSTVLRAEQDILLTDAFLLYASHLLSGKVDPVTLDADWHVTRREGNPIELFNSTIKSNNYNSAIHNLIPDNEHYELLKSTLADYREISNTGGWEIIPTGKTISPGNTDDRIPAIRKRLELTHDVSLDTAIVSENIYDEELKRAVIKFQQRHGFSGDGKIDEPTIREMNIPVEDRIKQIELNLERWRWMPKNFSDYYLLVNIANYELQVIKNGKTERIHRIVAGKPVRKTPVFSSKISYLVFNPTWTVPPTILFNDVLPEVKKSTQYLKNKNIKVLDAQGNILNPDSINWSSSNVKGLTYRQDPGPQNALGAVKFMFPNKFNVYIHDTPSKELFAKSQRAFSSGCIRVEAPLILAEYLLSDPAKWNSESIRKIVATNETQTIILKSKPDVHILYWTCWSSNGTVQFRKDIYERDVKLYEALKTEPKIDVEFFLTKK